MSKEPKTVREVYELMKRIQEKKEKISEEEIAHNLKKAIENKENQGIWIKHEEDSSKEKFSFSYLQIAAEKSLLGYRIANKSNHGEK